MYLIVFTLLYYTNIQTVNADALKEARAKLTSPSAKRKKKDGDKIAQQNEIAQKLAQRRAAIANDTELDEQTDTEEKDEPDDEDKPDDNKILNKLYFKIFGDIVKLTNPRDFILFTFESYPRFKELSVNQQETLRQALKKKENIIFPTITTPSPKKPSRRKSPQSDNDATLTEDSDDSQHTIMGASDDSGETTTVEDISGDDGNKTDSSWYDSFDDDTTAFEESDDESDDEDSEKNNKNSDYLVSMQTSGTPIPVFSVRKFTDEELSKLAMELMQLEDGNYHAFTTEKFPRQQNSYLTEDEIAFESVFAKLYDEYLKELQTIAEAIVYGEDGFENRKKVIEENVPRHLMEIFLVFEEKASQRKQNASEENV